jgi:stage V sporulation protein S
MGSPDEVVRVGAATPVHELASAVAHACYEGTPPTLRAIGAGAVNQAMKALAMASQYVAGRAMYLSVRPGFVTIDLDDKPNVTAMIFKVVISRDN